MSKVAMVLGAGAAGAAATSDVAREQIRTLLGGSGGGASQVAGGAASAVSDQVRDLSYQLRDLQRGLLSHPTVIVAGGQGGGSGLSPTVVAVVAGGAAISAGYMYVRGIPISSLFYVTRAKLEEATAALGEKLQEVNAALAQAATSLNNLLGEAKEQLQGDISNMRGALEEDISHTRADVRGVREQVGVVHSSVEGVASQVNNALGQIEHTNRGMWLLLNAVSETIPAQSPAMAQLRQYVQAQPPPPAITDGTGSNRSSGQWENALPAPPLPAPSIQRAISMPAALPGGGGEEAVEAEGNQLSRSNTTTSRPSSATFTGFLGF